MTLLLTFFFRRAKIKLLAKKSIETGEDIDTIPETYRTYLAIQAQETGKTFPKHLLGSGNQMGLGGHSMMTGEPNNSQKVGKQNHPQFRLR